MVWRPFPEIASGSITDASFVAQLWTVYIGRGNVDPRYREPIEFFERTFFSEGLRSTLANAVKRVTVGEGDPVILLSTTFGGGKTHTLLSIYHLLRNTGEALKSKRLRGALGKDIVGIIEEHLVGGKRKILVLALDGSALDPTYLERHGYPTYWRFLLEPLAEKTGDEKLIEHARAYSDPGSPPGYQFILDILVALEKKSYAVVLLLDELSELLVRLGHKNRSYPDAMISFLDALARAVSLSKYSLAVYSLAERSASRYEEYNRRLEEDLLSLVGRVSRPRNIIGRREAPHVIKSALLEYVDNEEAGRRAREYYGMYSRDKSLFPGTVSTLDYLDELRASYPFHPYYVHLAYSELAQLPEFQATRDILRLSARIIYHKYVRGDNKDYVLPSDIDVYEKDILWELLDRHGYNGLSRAVEADRPNLERMDTQYYDKHMIPNLASRVYGAVLLKSVALKPMSAEELRLAVLRPDMVKRVEPVFIDQVADRLEHELIYFHAIRRGGETSYIVRDRPNLRRLVEREAHSIEEDEAYEELRRLLSRRTRGSGDVACIVWPRYPSDIRDDPRLKIIYLDPKRCLEGNCMELMNELVLNAEGGGFRRYKNTLVFLRPDREEYRKLIDDVRKLMGCDKVKKNLEKYGITNNIQGLDELRREYASRVDDGVISLYNNVCYPIGLRLGENRVELLCEPIDSNPLLVDNILSILKDRQKIATGVSKDYLYGEAKKWYREMGREVSARELAETFASDLEKPYIIGLHSIIYSVLRELAREGRIIILREGRPLVPFNRGILDEDKILPCLPEIAERLGLDYRDGVCTKKARPQAETATVPEPRGEGVAAKRVLQPLQPLMRPIQVEKIRASNLKQLIDRLRSASKETRGVRILRIEFGGVKGDKVDELLRAVKLIATRLLDLEWQSLTLQALLTAHSPSGDEVQIDAVIQSEHIRRLQGLEAMLRSLRSYIASDAKVDDISIYAVSSKGVDPEKLAEALETKLLTRYHGLPFKAELEYITPR